VLGLPRSLDRSRTGDIEGVAAASSLYTFTHRASRPRLTVKAEARLVDHVTSSDDAKPLKKHATGGAQVLVQLRIRSVYALSSIRFE
jgi:hypothetical protein